MKLSLKLGSAQDVLELTQKDMIQMLEKEVLPNEEIIE